MVDTGCQFSTILQCIDLLRSQFESQEIYGRCFLFIRSLEIFVRDLLHRHRTVADEMVRIPKEIPRASTRQDRSPDHGMDNRACGNLLVIHSSAGVGANPSAEGFVSKAASVSTSSSTVPSGRYPLCGTARPSERFFHLVSFDIVRQMTMIPTLESF